jgi:hypothetical protein
VRGSRARIVLADDFAQMEGSRQMEVSPAFSFNPKILALDGDSISSFCLHLLGLCHLSGT